MFFSNKKFDFSHILYEKNLVGVDLTEWKKRDGVLGVVGL